MAQPQKKGSWTMKEVQLLKRLFPYCRRTRDVTDFLQRPRSALRQKAYSVWLKTALRRKWTSEQIRLLRQLYSKQSDQQLAKRRGHSERAVATMAHRLGLKNNKNHRPWSDDQIRKLKGCYCQLDSKAIAVKKGRSVADVRAQAHNLGISKKDCKTWPEDELQFLKFVFGQCQK